MTARVASVSTDTSPAGSAARVTNASRAPSADHAACSPAITGVTAPPVGATVTTSPVGCSRVVVNAIRSPPGDQAGSVSAAGSLVIRTGTPPPAGTT